MVLRPLTPLKTSLQLGSPGLVSSATKTVFMLGLKLCTGIHLASGFALLDDCCVRDSIVN